ncbi:MAG TPA: tyrosine-type recombinase/integrase, partial [Rugosimonospora sp.]|nr:tyrosine-type recombinase/integrase [Rugosimonospora sp.]
MYRKSHKYTGVYQRCTQTCPADRCRVHKWSYMVELPPGPDGKRRQLTDGGYASAKEAADARAEVIRQDRAGDLPVDRKMLFGPWLDEWLAAKVARGELEESTARTYQDQIRDYLKPKLGHRKVGELRGLDITRMYREIAQERADLIAQAQATNAAHAEDAERENTARRLAGRNRMIKPRRVPVPRPLSPVTIKRIHAIVSGALKSAVRAGLLTRNVAADAELPKVERRKVRPPTPEGYGEMLDAISDERLYPFVLVAGHSGLRRGELAGLRWADVDLKTGRIVVCTQRTTVGYQVREKSTKTEAGDERIVHLDDGTLNVLTTWRAQQATERETWGAAYHDSDYVFTREDGRPYHPEYLSRVYKRLATRAGMRTTKLHGMRHFRASA